ncbi:MAG: hypothetical protein LQ338_008166, partial [Usnochroma carphineum]
HLPAHSIAIPVVVYTFMGVEIVAVTAFEARNPKALRFPAKWIAYVSFFLEFFLVLGEVLTVHWQDPSLQALDQRDAPAVARGHKYTPIFILAPLNARIRVLPGFLSGCIIFCLLSCANTALYVASRTLFGLTREIPSSHTFWLMRWLSRLGTTTPRTLEIHNHNLTGPHAKYNRRQRMERKDQYSSFLSYFQPAVAWLGLVGCLAIVLIFKSASWWNGDITVRKVLVAYTAPLVLSMMWISMKAFKHLSNTSRWESWYVELSDDWEPLSTVLAHLEWKIEEKVGANGRSESNEAIPETAVQRTKEGASLISWIIQRPARAFRRSRQTDVSSLAEADDSRAISEMAHSRMA